MFYGLYFDGIFANFMDVDTMFRIASLYQVLLDGQ